MALLLLLMLLVLVACSIPNYGFWPKGVIGTLILILLILELMGRLPVSR
jgi:apolipoprotein N-acyltransferase